MSHTIVAKSFRKCQRTFKFNRFSSIWSFFNVTADDNTKFRKFSKIGVWSDFGARSGHEAFKKSLYTNVF